MPRDIASRAAKNVCDEGRGVGPGGLGVYLDFADAIERLGRKAVEDKYGNLFEMYERITGEDPYEVPMRIYPAVHYTMGGLWVDYDLQSTIPGLFVDRRGQLLRPRREPARRLRADAGPGRRLLRAAVHDQRLPRRAARSRRSTPTTRRWSRRAREVEDRHRRGCSRSTATARVDSFHRELGQLMWEYCGMERTEEGLRKALELIRGAARGVLAAGSRCPAPARSSTSRWRRPAASPTSSSSPS